MADKTSVVEIRLFNVSDAQRQLLTNFIREASERGLSIGIKVVEEGELMTKAEYDTWLQGSTAG